MNDFKDLQEEFEAIKARMVERGREVFSARTKEIFETYPTLESFSWSQYTPYWNDGEPCYFSVNDYLHVVFTDGELEDWDSYSRKYSSSNGLSEEHMSAGDAASELVGAIPDEVMEDLFGDHVKVIVSRDKVEVEEYEHE